MSAVAEAMGMLAEQTVGIPGSAMLMPFLAEIGSLDAQVGTISRSELVTPLVTLCNACLVANG